MKTLLTILLLASTLTLQAQTKIYPTTHDGIIKDKNQCWYFEHSTGKLYFQRGTEKIQTPNYIFKIENEKIFRYNINTKEKTELGSFSSTTGNIMKGTRVVGFIRSNKIHSNETQIDGVIEGKTIYGAVAFLIELFK